MEGTIGERILRTAGWALAMGLVCSPVLSRPGEWPQWRGPNRDGVSTETGLLQKWPPEGPPLRWKVQGAGEGYSTVSVSGGRLFTMGAWNGKEYVVAFDAETGKRLWASRSGKRYEHNRGGGPRGTPTVDGDWLYALGANGDLSCLDVATGKVQWSVNLLQKFDASNIGWGISESPLVLEDRVLVNAGGQDASIVAFDKHTGSVLWQSQSDRAGYSSAVFTDAGGIPEAIFFTGERALGVDVRNGKLLWEYGDVANRTANVATPIVFDRYVFLSSDYGTGCVLLELTPRKDRILAEEVYFHRNMRNHHSSSVLVGDFLYGFSGSILTALHFKEGKVSWKHRSVGKGSLVYADGHLYCFSEKGVMGLVEANLSEYVEKGRFQIPTGSWPTWSHPVVVGGNLYLRDQDTLYSFDVKARRQ